jgi:hypothetical protein
MPDAAQETCKIRLELARNATDPQKLTGYESKSCVPTPILQGGRVTRESIPQLIRDTRPIEAVLTGSVQNGDIVFQVDKTIGTPPTGSCGALQIVFTDAVRKRGTDGPVAGGPMPAI